MVKIKKIREKMLENNVKHLVITQPNDIFYLVGHAPNQLSVSGNNNIACLYISLDSVELITMDYEAKFIKQVLSPDVLVTSYPTWTGIGSLDDYKSERSTDTSINVVSILNSRIGNDVVGLQMSSISNQFALNFEKYIDISNFLYEMKAVKTQEEIDVFRKLCKIQTTALNAMTNAIKPGVSELELINIYRKSVFESNYCVPSAWTMLCSGKNSAYLSTPTAKLIEDGDVIKFDGGVNLEFSYFTTDMSRSFTVGNCSKELTEIKKTLVAAQKLIIDNIKPGVMCCELYKIGYEYVKSFYPGYVRGHLGHSISFGPSTFEPPFINPADKTILQPGMIFCIEVPLYIDEIGGFNIEDMVLVTETGAEVLTKDIDHFELEHISKQL